MITSGKKRHEGKVATRQMGGRKCEGKTPWRGVAAIAVGEGKTSWGDIAAIVVGEGKTPWGDVAAIAVGEGKTPWGT